MSTRTLAAALAVAGAIAAARTSTAAAASIAESTSSNWAGYVVGGQQFSSVSGKVAFTSATATAGGHTGSIADSGWTAERVQLVAGNGRFGGPEVGFDRTAGAARTSALRSGGSAFSVRWRASAGTTYAA